MLLKIQKYRLTQYFWLLIAFHFINLSIDIEYDNRSFSTIGLNEQESIVELLLEKVIGFDDIIPENDHDDDMDDFKPNKVQLSYQELPILNIDLNFTKVKNIKKHFNRLDCNKIPDPDYKINTPPPEYFSTIS